MEDLVKRLEDIESTLEKLNKSGQFILAKLEKIIKELKVSTPKFEYRPVTAKSCPDCRNELLVWYDHNSLPLTCPGCGARVVKK